MAEDTRDEAFFWISRRQERQMEEELEGLKGVVGQVNAELDQRGLEEYDGDAGEGASEATGDGDGSGAEADAGDDGDAGSASAGTTPGQSGLDAFSAPTEGADDEDDGTDDEGGESSAEGEDDEDDEDDEGVLAGAGREEGVEVVVDQRELDATIARDLSTREGIETRLETLAVGDYVLSDRVAVERKSVADFLDTLTGGDRSLFEQVRDAARNYARPVVIVEGEDLYGSRNVHPNAIRGALSSLAVDFGASVLRTRDETDTADLLEVIARREQEESDRSVRVHGEKADKTLAEQQEYVVSSIADVGPVTARALLEAFGSVEAVMTASREDLLGVSGIGEVTADRIREVAGATYPGTADGDADETLGDGSDAEGTNDEDGDGDATGTGNADGDGAGA
jgi:Fanconi anemia group M protein